MSKPLNAPLNGHNLHNLSQSWWDMRLISYERLQMIYAFFFGRHALKEGKERFGNSLYGHITALYPANTAATQIGALVQSEQEWTRNNPNVTEWKSPSSCCRCFSSNISITRNEKLSWLYCGLRLFFFRSFIFFFCSQSKVASNIIMQTLQLLFVVSRSCVAETRILSFSTRFLDCV